MTRWLLVIGLALFAAAAGAHKPSDSYLNLRVTENRIEGQWDIALRDLELAVGLDSNGDGEITWGEVRAQHGAIAEYAQKRLTIRNGGAVCPLRVLEHQVDEHSDGAYAVMRLAGECSQSITQLEIEYRLLFDRDAQHRGLLRLQSASGEVTAIFPIDKPVQRFTLGSASLFSQLLSFVADGVKHIAIGFDHILFLLALLLPAVMVRPDRQWLPQKDLRTTFWSVFSIVTAFTIAHSITLSLAALEVVQLPSRLVESLIAASVLLTAIDNVVPFLPRRRWLITFAFGLVHGFGFASVLLDLQLPKSSLLLSLFGFNVGVELGQLALVALVVPLAFVVRMKRSYLRFVVRMGSCVIALVSAGWFVERAFQFSFMPF